MQIISQLILEMGRAFVWANSKNILVADKLFDGSRTEMHGCIIQILR